MANLDGRVEPPKPGPRLLVPIIELVIDANGWRDAYRVFARISGSP